jgi:hypothetical protein
MSCTVKEWLSTYTPILMRSAAKQLHEKNAALADDLCFEI